MKHLFSFVYKVDVSLHVISGLVLGVMLLVTLSDVIMRIFWRPIFGSIEIVCFSGAVAIGLALPYSSWKKAHVFVDMLINELPQRWQINLQVATKSIGLLLFLCVGINFILYSLDLMQSGEVSKALELPFYPITFGLALSCFMVCLTLLCDVLKLAKGGNDE